MELKFIPMRGRKQVWVVLFGQFAIVEIYPREGTETPSIIKVFVIDRVEIYPREGTETYSGVYSFQV